MDSDDWLHPDFLKLLYGAAEQTMCKISACGFFNTTGAEIPENQDTTVKVLSADDYYCDNFHRNATPAACNKLYNRYLFKHLRFPIGKLHEDEFTTYLALYQAGKIAAVPAALYAYYQNPQGITHSDWNPRRMHALEAFEQQILFAQTQNNQRLLKKTVLQYIYGIHEQLMASQIVYHKELRRKLQTALKMGRECGCFPGDRQHSWAYEAAYPCKPFWWLLSKIWK